MGIIYCIILNLYFDQNRFKNHIDKRVRKIVLDPIFAESMIKVNLKKIGFCDVHFRTSEI